MRVLGVDPGSTTGVALWTDEGDPSTGSTGGRLLAYKEITGMEEGDVDERDWRQLEYRNALAVWSWVLNELPDLVVIEDFVLQPGKQGEYRGGSRAGLSPARIGAIIYAFMLLDAEGDMVDESRLGGTEAAWDAYLAGGTETRLSGAESESGVVGLMPTVLWQQASMIKTMTSTRIRKAGLWVVGSQHIRDAACHAYVGYGRLSSGSAKRGVGDGSAARVGSGGKARGTVKATKKVVGGRKRTSLTASKSTGGRRAPRRNA